MSDQDKQIAAALSRIAAMESELAGFRKSAREKPQAPAPQFDSAAFLASYVRDPIGTISRLGANQDQMQHVTKVHFAHAMGDAAPPEMKMLAQMGPQVAATSQLTAQLAAISQRLEGFEQGVQKKSTRESFAAAAVDKAKYPHLAVAYAADPSLFEDEVDGYKGDAAELASRLEARQSKLAAVYGKKIPAASEANADEQNDPSKQVELAPATGIDPTPPQLSQSKPGPWTQEDHVRERDAIVRKYSSQS